MLQVPVVQFYAKWDLERNFDYVQFQGSTNGSTWVTLCGRYTKPGSDIGTNRYSSGSSSDTSTGKSTADRSNQPSDDLIYDGDTMDKWVLEEIVIDATNNTFLLGDTNAQFRFLFDSESNNRADGYPTTFDGFVFDDFKVISLSGIPCEDVVDTFPYAESFENGLRLWQQTVNDDLDWSFNDLITYPGGGTPSNGTGPQSGTPYGSRYLFTEASSNGVGFPNKVAELISPCFDFDGYTDAELSFSYHMFGTSLGTFRTGS